MSKRFLIQQLAKEDVKRSKNGETSICKQMSTEECFTSMYEMIVKKSKANEIDNYMKTPDTWMRRLGTATVAQMTQLVDFYVTTSNVQINTRVNPQEEKIYDDKIKELTPNA